MVRAKFKVDEIRRIRSSVPMMAKSEKIIWVQGEVRTILLTPVSPDGDPQSENTTLWTATPSGKIEIGCANLQAAEEFELGQEYYVDFHRAK